MSFEQRGPFPLDYAPALYPGSVIRFRGPATPLAAPYILCLGGSETFGRFIPAPYPARLAAALRARVVNMGVMHAGLDVLMQDDGIRAARAGAAALVLQVTGAQNMSNRFYTVHPRRNDRFVRASHILRTIYRDVDFTEFHFTRHLLTHLKALSADRFAIVEAELRAAWLARMKGFLGQAGVPVHLLWLSRRAPDAVMPEVGLGCDPLFVTAAMLAEVAPFAASVTLAVSAPPDGPEATRGMFYAAREAGAARALPGPDAHERAAALLRDRLA
jgi:hypothetical protein